MGFFSEALEKLSFWFGVRFRGLVWRTKHLYPGGVHGSAARLLFQKKKKREREERKKKKKAGIVGADGKMELH